MTIKNQSQDWGLIKNFNKDRGKLKLVINAHYVVETFEVESPETSAHESLTLYFNIIEEDNTEHSVSFSTRDVKNLPKNFSISPQKTFFFKGDYEYKFYLSCTNKTNQS